MTKYRRDESHCRLELCPTLNSLLTYFLSLLLASWPLLMKQIKFWKIVIYLLPLWHSLGPLGVIFIDLWCHWVVNGRDVFFGWQIHLSFEWKPGSRLEQAHTHTHTEIQLYHLPYGASFVFITRLLLTCILHLRPPCGAADYKVMADNARQ